MYKRLAKLGITENHLQVLCLFTKGFDGEYYIREVQKLLKISPRTAQLVLDDLEKKTILESKIKGKIRTYKIKKGEIAKNYLILAEQYKKTSFLEKNPLITEVISKSIPYIKGIAVIFGSYAKGLQKEESDIDIFIIGTYKKKEIIKTAGLYGVSLNIKRYPLEVFEKNIQKDILIREVLNNHIIIFGLDDFINMMIK